MSQPEFVEAIPFHGYLPHAIRNIPQRMHRTAPFVVITYNRALCGVGVGGMRVRLDEDGNPRPWKGINGCNTCHVKMHKLKQSK